MRLKILLPIVCGYAASACLPLWGNDQWRECDSPTSASLVSVAFGNDTYVAVGESIVYSSDTVQWEESLDGPDYVLHQVIFADDRFFAVGRGSDTHPKLLSSVDGEFWDAALLPVLLINPAADLRSIAYDGGVWIAVGTDGAILRSENGTSWSIIADVTEEDLTAVVATDAGFTAFTNGWIYNSRPPPLPRRKQPAPRSDRDRQWRSSVSMEQRRWRTSGQKSGSAGD